MYFKVEPFSAVQTSSTLLSPSDTSTSPVPVTDAFESLVLALIFTFSVFESSVTLYSYTSGLKSGSNLALSTVILFSLLSFE